MGTSVNEEKNAAGRLFRGKLKNDILLIGVILLAVLAASTVMLLLRAEGDSVIVTVDGEIYGEYPLDADTTVRIICDGGYNVLVIEGGRALVSEASCPDLICASHRPVEHDGESIICLPNKTVIRVRRQGSDEPDIIS